MAFFLKQDEKYQHEITTIFCNMCVLLNARGLCPALNRLFFVLFEDILLVQLNALFAALSTHLAHKATHGGREPELLQDE